MSVQLDCWNCGAPLAGLILPLSRHEYCAGCGEALHCCRQCAHHDPRTPGQCRESRAEPPTNKEAANFCDWLAPVPAAGAAGRVARTPADEARARLEALFGPPAAEQDPGA